MSVPTVPTLAKIFVEIGSLREIVLGFFSAEAC
jgi:hypothetical protein